MKENKLIIYDPGFTSKGHFLRFNIYFLKLLSSQKKIKNIYYFGKKIYKNKKITYKKIIELSDYEIKDFSKIKKIAYYMFMLLKYYKVIKFLDTYGKNKILVLLSESNLFFNLILYIFYQHKYIIVSIHSKNFYNKGFFSSIIRKIYTLSYDKAEAIITLNKTNKKQIKKYLNKKNIFILPERNL